MEILWCAVPVILMIGFMWLFYTGGKADGHLEEAKRNANAD